LTRGAERAYEILRYGGMGHTAGVHTRSREAAVRFGSEMPASRITVNTPTTHGAIGFSTALPPSMTLGCGSWGGNVTSDNVSPLHLLDIKRVAFETRPVKSTRPALGASTVAAPPPAYTPSPAPGQRATQSAQTTQASQTQAASSGAPRINREDIAAIVDRFLAGRPSQESAGEAREPRQDSSRTSNEVEAGSMYAGPSESRSGNAAQSANSGNGGNGGRSSSSAASAASSSSSSGKSTSAASANGNKAVDFVSEDDVRRALQKGEKIYINAKTIITPAARDMGEPAEIFAKS
jgi:hypothetical protein